MPPILVIWYIVAETVPGALSGLDKGNLEGYGVKSSVYQSPFYRVEIPSSPYISPLGYNWDSWSINSPYDYWWDLKLDSIIANTHEDPKNLDVKDAEVYCDNHGIAGVLINNVDKIDGTVTVTATAEFPNSLLKGKYGPRTSEEITAKWGIVEMNPHFVADKIEIPVGGTVTFTNLTTGGQHPYTKAEWDFDANGIFDKTITGTEANVMQSVTYTYNTQGIYTVKLQMTDSVPTTRYEERLVYIKVGPPEGIGINWNCPIGGQTLIAPNPGAGRPILAEAAPCSGITVKDGAAQLWGIYYLVETGPGAGTWLYYIPGFASNTLTQLVPGKYYYVVVSTACTVVIPQ